MPARGALGPVGRVAVRSWPRALGLAALTLWLPALLPYWIGPLQECGHCMASYSLCLPIVPGIFAPILLRLDGVLFAVAGAVMSLVMFGAVIAALRYLPKPWSVATQTATIVVVAFVALVFGALLRA